ncbi:hypothetical protein B0H14DRAFT_2621061 [Mycena olivaceomarginata]|nr:hypothetical protein B0H14DRAFT_2621061 [Mycena olivaceomarginata]
MKKHDLKVTDEPQTGRLRPHARSTGETAMLGKRIPELHGIMRVHQTGLKWSAHERKLLQSSVWNATSTSTWHQSADIAVRERCGESRWENDVGAPGQTDESFQRMSVEAGYRTCLSRRALPLVATRSALAVPLAERNRTHAPGSVVCVSAACAVRSRNSASGGSSTPRTAPPLAVPPVRALILAASAAPGVVRARACVAACAVRSWTGASSPQTARKLAQRRSMRPPRLGAAPRGNGPEQWVTAIVVLRARQTRDVHSRKGMKQRKRERKEKKRKKKKGKKDGDAPGMTCWKQVDVGQRSSRRRRRRRVQSSKSVEEDEEELDESFEDGDVDEEEPT